MGFAKVPSFVSQKNEREKNAIISVLNAYSSNSKKISDGMSSGDKYWDSSDAIDRLVIEMKLIKLDDCPPDFKSAYIKHIDAWTSAKYAAKKCGGAEGFVRGFFIIPGAFAIAELEEAKGNIKNTFIEVKKCAKEHGVEQPD